jgi:RNA polymerase sigma factor (sigma-70 family)
VVVRGQDPFAALLARARAGDAGAWSDLYHDVAPIVIGYLRAQRLPDPEDVAGEVLLEIVRGIERFTGDRSGFRSWALTIAHHRLLDARRRADRRPSTPTEQLDTAWAPDDPEAETLAADGFGRLEPALRELTDDQRTVLLLRVIGDLSVADVARITGKRQGAVKQLQQRAAAAMRATLDRDAATSAADRAARGAAAGGRAPMDAERTVSRFYRSPRDADRSEDASQTRWTT